MHYHTEFWAIPAGRHRVLPRLPGAHRAGIWALFQRREFHWKAVEPLQLALGLSIPMLIIVHVVGVRLGQTLYGHEKLYPQELLHNFFIASPLRLWQMLAG